MEGDAPAAAAAQPRTPRSLPAIASGSRIRSRSLLAIDASAGSDAELASLCKRLPSSLLATDGLGMLASAMAAAADAPAPSLAVPGAALIVEADGVSALARVLSRSHAPAEAAGQLSSALEALLAGIGGRLHRHGADLLALHGPPDAAGRPAALAFVSARGGDGGGEEALREAAAAALAAAREIATVEVDWAGHRLALRLAIGVGTLEVLCLRPGPGPGFGSGEELFFGGDAVLQARGAQRAAWGTELLLSPEAAQILGDLAPSEPLPAPSPLRRALRVPPSAAPPAPAGAAACSCGWILSPRLATGPRARSALVPYLPILRRLAAPAPPPTPAPPLELRRAAVLAAALGGWHPSGSPLSGSHAGASSLGGILGALLSTANEHGGRFGGLWLDERSPAALLWFGLGGVPPEDDPERAVRAALALQARFESAGAPFSCGVAEGSMYHGTVGPPCRLAYTLVGDAVSLAARLMEEAKPSSSNNNNKGRSVLCSGGLVQAIAARGRASSVVFDEAASVRVEGFEGPVRGFRPSSRRPSLVPGTGSPQRRRSLSSGPPRALSVSFRRHAREFVVEGCCGREAELTRLLSPPRPAPPRPAPPRLAPPCPAPPGALPLYNRSTRPAPPRPARRLASCLSSPPHARPPAQVRVALDALCGPGRRGFSLVLEGQEGDEASLAELLAARGILPEPDAAVLAGLFRGPLL
eukprot:tig00000282_g23835.t1